MEKAQDTAGRERQYGELLGEVKRKWAISKPGGELLAQDLLGLGEHLEFVFHVFAIEGWFHWFLSGPRNSSFHWELLVLFARLSLETAFTGNFFLFRCKKSQVQLQNHLAGTESFTKLDVGREETST